MKGYHISPKKDRGTILKEGLKPVLGPRSSRFGEEEPKLFFTPDLEDSVKLAKNRRFNSHPDFTGGLDIWEIKINKNSQIEKDHKSPDGYFIKEIVGVLDMELVKSLEWMDK
jgi:hypothetical protein